MIFSVLLSLSWFTQNVLAVLSNSALLVPDIFLLYILYKNFSDFSRDLGNEILLIWVLFFGGILWDLRWIGIPGLFAFIYTGTFLFASWFWDLFPESGHTTFVFFIILWISQLPGFFTGLYLWNVETEYYFKLMLIYQAYSIPLSAMFSLLYVRKLKLQNA
jgi:rod shape-determining protein MreD